MSINNLLGSTFASKTTRQQKVSQTPGPGTYLHDHSGVHRIVKNLPEGFGSTSTKCPNFLNVNISAPFSEPTYLLNPGVGNYVVSPTAKTSHSSAIKKSAGECGS